MACMLYNHRHNMNGPDMITLVQAHSLSRDHKPDLEIERDRILKAGGFIHAGRVNGSLNLARAIGM